MSIIKSFMQFTSSLFENKKKTYDYGCAMVYFDFPQMQQFHQSIDESDIFIDSNDPTFGLEKEPHTTLLYGLHSNEIDDARVMEICKSKRVGQLTLTNASLFENEKFDVLKFDVSNPVLAELNAELVKLPHTTNFPDYHPHATVAYLKPGSGKKYVEKFVGHTYQVTPNKIVYSKPDGTKIEEPWS